MELYIVGIIIGLAVLMISCYTLGKSNGEAPLLFGENAEIEELEKENKELRKTIEAQRKRIEYLLNFRESQEKVDEDF